LQELAIFFAPHGGVRSSGAAADSSRLTREGRARLSSPVVPSSTPIRAALLAAALAASFAVGFRLGRSTEAPPQVASSRATASPDLAGPRLPVPEVPGDTPLERPPGREHRGLELALGNAGAAAAVAVAGDPLKTANAVIDSMSDRELRSLVSSATNLSESELDALRDVRGYARRLSELAIDGMFREPEPAGADVRDVRFSDAVDAANRPVMQRDRFSPGDVRIYAVFPTDGYSLGDVVVKWYRADPPEMLLFGRYPIRRDERQGHVWVEQPRGWSEGEYRVDFYSGDSALVRLASGTYSVTTDDDASR
jgi:hypothetical protein